MTEIEIQDALGGTMWRLLAAEPQALWVFAYGVPQIGFSVETEPEELSGNEEITVLASIRTTDGIDVTTRDHFVLKRLRPGEVFVTQSQYLLPGEYDGWSKDHVCSSSTGILGGLERWMLFVILGAASVILIFGVLTVRKAEKSATSQIR